MSDFDKRGASVRIRPWYALLSLVAPFVLLLAPFPFIAWSLGAALAFFPAFFLALAGTFHILETRLWHSRRANVHADREGVTLDGRRFLARGGIVSVRVVVRDDQVVVRLDGGYRSIEVLVASEEEGRALVLAAGLDATRTVVSHWFTCGTRRRLLARTAAPFALVLLQCAMLAWIPRWFGPDYPPLVVLVPALLAVGLVLAGGPRFAIIAVGADGLGIRRGYGRKRFVPYDDVEGLDAGDGELTLRIRGEAPLVLSAGGVLKFIGRSGELNSAFVRRVEENLAVHRSRSEHDVEFLARARRSTRQWVSDLEDLSEGRAAYRVAAPPPDILWRIVEDATSPATERAGAAVVLRTSLDEGGRVRLRAAAEACASPRLRIAFDAACAGNANALAEALDAVEDDRPKPLRVI